MRQYLSDSISATIDNIHAMIENNYATVDNSYATMSMRQFPIMTWQKLRDDQHDHATMDGTLSTQPKKKKKTTDEVSIYKHVAIGVLFLVKNVIWKWRMHHTTDLVSWPVVTESCSWYDSGAG